MAGALTPLFGGFMAEHAGLGTRPILGRCLGPTLGMHMLCHTAHDVSMHRRVTTVGCKVREFPAAAAEAERARRMGEEAAADETAAHMPARLSPHLS